MTVRSRRGIRDDVSRYEAVSLAMVEMADADFGSLLSTYPAEDSPLRLEQFLQALYLHYDERFFYSPPDLKSVTKLPEWCDRSSAFGAEGLGDLVDYPTRLVG